MRVVVALGGNALLRRGQALNAENQRENIRLSAEQLALVSATQPVLARSSGLPAWLPSPSRSLNR